MAPRQFMRALRTDSQPLSARSAQHTAHIPRCPLVNERRTTTMETKMWLEVWGSAGEGIVDLAVHPYPMRISVTASLRSVSRPQSSWSHSSASFALLVSNLYGSPVGNSQQSSWGVQISVCICARLLYIRVTALPIALGPHLRWAQGKGRLALRLQQSTAVKPHTAPSYPPSACSSSLIPSPASHSLRSRLTTWLRTRSKLPSTRPFGRNFPRPSSLTSWTTACSSDSMLPEGIGR